MFLGLALVALAAGATTVCHPAAGTPDEAAIMATDTAVREAFARGDIDTIALYHHPEVVKSLAPERFFAGEKALREDLANTFSTVDLDFGQNDREMLKICGDTALSIVRFSIDYSAKDGSFNGTAYGRAMIVMVRSDRAPHGWVTLSEVVQPAPAP